jgi:hypothetical protein
LYKEKICGLYRSPNIVRILKLRGLRWDEHVARIRQGMHTKFWSRTLLKIDHFGRTEEME